MVQKTHLIKKANEMLAIECDTWAKNALAYDYNSSLSDLTDVTQKAEAKKQADAAQFNCEGALKRIAWLENFIKKNK